MADQSPTLYDISDIPRESKIKIRELHYDKHISHATILKRIQGLTAGQLQAILEEPDDLGDFRMHKFNNMTRNLMRASELVLESIQAQDVADATLSQRTSLLKTCTEQVQKLHDLHLLHMEQNEDFKLARLLAMGREEARQQLLDRFRSLAHVLFGSMTPNEVALELKLITGDKTDLKESSHASRGKPRLVKIMGGGEDDDPGTGGDDGAGSSSNAQGVGAFRGIKKGKPS